MYIIILSRYFAASLQICSTQHSLTGTNTRKKLFISHSFLDATILASKNDPISQL